MWQSFVCLLLVSHMDLDINPNNVMNWTFSQCLSRLNAIFPILNNWSLKIHVPSYLLFKETNQKMITLTLLSLLNICNTKLLDVMLLILSLVILQILKQNSSSLDLSIQSTSRFRTPYSRVLSLANMKPTNFQSQMRGQH